MTEHRDWYSRGYLPHLDRPGLLQFITFRTADSLPQVKLREWKEELRRLEAVSAIQSGSRAEERSGAKEKYQKRIEEWLDRGLGSCPLRDAALAGIVEDALLAGDGVRYRLIAWVIMPNHVHALIETRDGFLLDAIVQQWKSVSSRRCNASRGKTGSFWMPEFFDRYIRNNSHLDFIVSYIHGNPVSAHLVTRADQWRYSSAWSGRQTK